MHRNRSTQLAVISIAASLLAALAVGCNSGPETGEVRGKVTFKGQPVKEGTVQFLNNAQGATAGAEIKSDGTYEVPGGALLGDYIVVISPPVHIVDTDPGKSPPAPVEKDMPDVPRKYRMQGTTTLKAKIKSGKNEINFEMKP